MSILSFFVAILYLDVDVDFGPILFGLFYGLKRYVFFWVDVLITLMGLNLQNMNPFDNIVLVLLFVFFENMCG